MAISTFPEKNRRGLHGKVFDVIILHCALKSLQPLEGLLMHIRDFLKSNGTLVICDEFCIFEDGLNKTDFYLAKEVIAALYESGFSIKIHKKWPQRIKKGLDSLAPCVKGGDDMSGSSESPRLLGTFGSSCPKGVDVPFHMILGRKDDIFLRPYREGDEEAILPMFKEVFNAERSMAHWHWKFRDNPFGAYKIAQAFSYDGILAGHYSGYPVPFYSSVAKGERFLSFQIGDIMTRLGFRHVGLGKTSVLGRITDYFHQKFCVGHIPFLYGFVAGNHRKFGERFLGYQYMSEIPCHVMDLNHSTLKPDTWIKRIISGIRVEEVHDVNPAFDILFQKAAGNYGLLVKRDAGYLRWRYLDCPDGVYRIFALKRFGKLIGWSVFRVRGSVLIWGDALFEKSQAVFAGMLLEQLLKQQFSEVKRVEGWFSKNPAWWTNLLENMGFKVIKEPNGLVAGVTIFEPGVSLRSVEEQFYYTMGDSDLF